MVQRTVSKEISEKAQRLVSEGRVRRVRGHYYAVLGDSGIEYGVYVADAVSAFGWCRCRAETLYCSHLIAASAFEVANPLLPVGVPAYDDPFAGIGN